VHGGIAEKLQTLEEIRQLPREEIAKEGGITDLLWSDPCGEKGYSKTPRGAGQLFGEDVAKEFLKKNNLKTIVRAH